MKTFAKVLSIVLGILMIGCGVYCMFTPQDTYMSLGLVVGFSMIMYAVADFVIWGQEKRLGIVDGWTLAAGILSAVLGFFIINSSALQLGIDAFYAYYIAAWLVVLGIMVIVRAAKMRRFHKNWNTKMIGTRWVVPLIIGILMIAFGVLCLFKPVITVTMVGIFMGLGVVVSGIALITAATMPVED